MFLEMDAFIDLLYGGVLLAAYKGGISYVSGRGAGEHTAAVGPLTTSVLMPNVLLQQQKGC